MPIFDLSIPIRPSMFVWPDDPSVQLHRVASMAEGAICNVSRLDFGVHSGTHIDAPVHFIEGAAAVEETPLEALIGDAFVVDARAVQGDIDAATVRSLEIPSGYRRLLFKTRNSELWQRDEFSTSFAGITADGAEELMARGIELVGNDYLSVAPFADPAPTHVALLSHDVVVLEGLNLREVEPGAYRLICLPLLLVGSDGAPCRALLMRD